MQRKRAYNAAQQSFYGKQQLCTCWENDVGEVVGRACRDVELCC